MKGVFLIPGLEVNILSLALRKKILILGEAHWCVDFDSIESCKMCDFFKGMCSLTNIASTHFINYKKSKGEVESWLPTYPWFLKFEKNNLSPIL